MTAYGAKPPPRRDVKPTDRRYKLSRWKTLRLLVLNRDGWRCWVKNCSERATVADHINPVYPGMPDHEFFDRQNLRASCKYHNYARGVAARLERETAEGVEPRGFSSRDLRSDWLLSTLSPRKRSAVITTYGREVSRGIG